MEEMELVGNADFVNQVKLFLWFDSTTFLPYLEEAGDASNLLARKTGSSALSSLSSVWASLTPNAKNIYTIIIK